MNYTGLSDALKGIGTAIEKNPEGFSHVLGAFGQAISPEGSWQANLGGAAATMSAEESNRQFLQQLFGGQELPEEEEEEAISALSGGIKRPQVLGIGGR